MSEWIVYSKDGLTERCKLKRLEYSGSFMNERSVSATLEHHSEIQFDVFDYITYRGEVFELESIPTVKKTSSMDYSYELRFVSHKYELERCEMRDIVPHDNGIVYPTPLTFSFMGDVKYLAERINACLDAMYGNGVWKINIAEGVTSDEHNITIAQQNCWNALALVNSTFGLNFYIKGRNVTIGGSQPLVGHTFRYGKGNGLYEIERTANTDTGIVTKLRAYGSTRNLDYSYPKRPDWGDSILDTSFVLSPLRLMLPSFKLDGKTDYVMASDELVARYGIREASIVYDDIYPSISGATNGNGEPVDEIKSVEPVDDTKSTFAVYLYDLGFDLEEHLTNDAAQISMKTGKLQGYTFNMQKIEKQDDGTYIITLERITLSEGDTDNYNVPNSDWTMSAGDKFVLLNILMPQEYIRNAEERLLARANEYLSQYAKTNFSYSIGIHDKFLMENPSIYDELIEGSKLTIYDDEIGISEDVTIQSITITENAEDNILPQVKVVLNNEPSASTLERIQGQINDLANGTSGSYSAQSEVLNQYRRKLDRPYFDRLFVAVDKNGNEIPSNDLTTEVYYIKAKYNFASLGGMTMYVNDGYVDLPGIYDGLPIDGTTIYWETITNEDGSTTKVLKSAGSGEDGTADFSNVLESGEGNAFTSFTLSEDKKVLTFVKGESFAKKGDFDALNTKITDFLEGSDTDGIINKWKELETFLTGMSQSDELATILSGKMDKADFTNEKVKEVLGISDWALAATKPEYKFEEIKEKPSTLSEYGITDAYTKDEVNKEFGKYVTLDGKETITGAKDFTGGLSVNGSPIVYDAEKGYWMLTGDLLVTGTITMFANEGTYTPSTIMDAILYDDSTLGINADGELYVKGGTDGGIVEITSQMVIDALGYTPYSASNPNGYITGSALNGYATQSWVTSQGYATASALTSGLNGKADKATTLAGYGITDAKISKGVITLGENTITPVTQSYVDDTFVTIKGNEDVTGEHDFTNGLYIGGIRVRKSNEGVMFIEGNLVVKGGITMYGTDSTSAPDVMSFLNLDPNTLEINSEGQLTVIGGTGGGTADSVAWENITGKPTFAAVATSGSYNDLLNKPTIPTSLKNPYSLTFGSKTYDGSAAKEITASDLGALTSHQTIYNLTLQAGTFSATTFDPNGAAKTVNIPTTTSHISEGSNLYFTNTRAQAAITGGASSIVTSNLTASRVLMSDASGKVAASSVTSTELGYLDGVTSSIQTQLDGKLSLTGGTMTGTIKSQAIYPKTSNTYELGTSSYLWSNLYTKKATIDGIGIYKSTDGVLYIDGNLVVKGGVTMYGTDSTSAPDVMSFLNLDPDTLEINSKGQLTVIGGTSSGSVTSVGLSAPTGFSVSGSPITSSGTLTLSFASGYSLPTTAKQTNWDTAYGWGNHASAGYLTQTTGDSRYVTALSTSGNYLTYTKNGVINNVTVPYATTAKELTSYSAVTFSKSDNSGMPCYLLIADVTSWYNVSSGSSAYGIVGFVYGYRDGAAPAYSMNVSARCAYGKGYYSLQSSLTSTIEPRVVSYNSKYYLALYLKGSNRNFNFIGRKNNLLSSFTELQCSDSNGTYSGLSVIYYGSATGTVSTAAKLATERTISLTGDATGSGSFDGSANLSIATSISTRNVVINGNKYTVYSSITTDTTGIYAPTSGGTSGYVLKASGSTSVPTWTAQSDLSVGSATTATKLSTVSKTAWGKTYWTSGGVPDTISGDMTDVGSITMSGSINSAVTISSDTDGANIKGSGHHIYFGGSGYANQAYHFRPLYGSSGATTTSLYIQNASASSSPTFTTTHSFLSNGNATHSGTLTTGGAITTGGNILPTTDAKYSIGKYGNKFSWLDVNCISSGAVGNGLWLCGGTNSGTGVVIARSGSNTATGELCRFTDAGMVWASGVVAKIITTAQELQLKYNNSDANSIVLSSTSFKPFTAATDNIMLGRYDSRWKGVYLGTGSSGSNANGLQFCDTSAYCVGRVSSSATNLGIYSVGTIYLRGGCTKGASGAITVSSTGVTIDASGNLLATGGITMYSDERKKTILNHVELSLKQVADAPLIEHYYNVDEKKTTHVGSIAQYWAGLNDWFCKKDDEGFYTMEIQNAALASAISVARELDRYESKTDKQIRMLKKRINELEDEIEKLKTA